MFSFTVNPFVCYDDFVRKITMVTKIKSLIFSSLLFTLLLGCSPTNSESTTSTTEAPSVTSEVTLDYPLVTLNVQIPIDIASGDQIKVAGSFNGWDPFAADYDLSNVGGRNYTIDLPFTSDKVGTTIQYKYVLVLKDQTENPWANVEGTATGGETNNRSHKLVVGHQTKNDTVLSFKNNMNATTLTRGSLTKVTLTMSQYTPSRSRTIRIWTPDGYQANGSVDYPVIYMHDGQNLFDTFTGFSGEWEIDETIGGLMDLGYAGAIVVGIDNGGGERINELSPSWPLSSEATEYNISPSGEQYAAFIVETVKPYVDSNFNTLTGAEDTFIGGSSMGGVMSFYMVFTYPQVFSKAILFSSALWLYQSGTIASFINAKNVAALSNKPKVYIYCGGAETSITPYVSEIYNQLKTNGYTDALVKTAIVPNKDHNEAAWALHFPIAMRWLINFTG